MEKSLTMAVVFIVCFGYASLALSGDRVGFDILRSKQCFNSSLPGDLKMSARIVA